jgi:hypothetical protein
MNNKDLGKKYGDIKVQMTSIKETTANFDFQDENEDIRVHLEVPVELLPKIEREVSLNDLLKMKPDITINKLNK